MSKNVDKLLSLSSQFETQAIELAKNAKTDPKAKVRNRGKVVFPAESSNVKDKKDHFPINDADQARNALARVHQYDKVPSWYKGSLKSLQEAVARAVRKHYKGIDVGGKDKKSSLESSLIKQATTERFYDVVKDYENGGDCLADFIAAMNHSVEVFTKESGGLNNLSPQDEKIAHILHLEVQLLEKVLPEMRALDQQLYAAMEEPEEV